MKRKLLVLGDMRVMMKDIFGVNDKEIDQVVKFMGEDYDRILDAVKTAAVSDDLNCNQKMVVSYIVGNTSGVMQGREMSNMMGKDHDISPVGM
jgi:NADPH:quinone reductase-like Zn-dependent oxidoreductase